MIPYNRHIVLFKLQEFNVGVEGVFYGLGYLIFILLIYKYFKNSQNYSKKDMIQLIIGIIIFANIGGRLWTFLFPWEGFSRLMEFFYAQYSVIYTLGTIIGTIFFILFWNKRKKRTRSEMFATFDILAPFGLIMIFIIRLGCFINGHITGKISTLPWCLGQESCTHPVALYYSTSALIIFIFIKYFFSIPKKKDNNFGKRFHGEISLWFLVLFFFNRIWIDTLKSSESVSASFIEYRVAMMFIVFISIFILIMAYLIILIFNIKTFSELENLKKEIILPKKKFLAIIFYRLHNKIFRINKFSTTIQIKKIKTSGFSDTIRFLFNGKYKIIR